MRVAIIGQGYVGLTIAVGAAGVGHKVIGFDVNDQLVSTLNAAHHISKVFLMLLCLPLLLAEHIKPAQMHQ